VILDLSASPMVDLQSADTLAALADELTEAKIRFQAVETRSAVRERLGGEKADKSLGRISRFSSVIDAVEQFQQSDGAPAPPPT
jgi:MFS superfamily sulfate permease-like transporter